MPSIVVDGVTYQLPPDDSQAQKVPQYNAALVAMAGLSGILGAAWTSWTPTWTNLTVGNGTVVAKYQRVGKTVFCRLSIVFGSTSSISGAVSFSLPVTRATNAGNAGSTPQGTCQIFDASVPVNFAALITNSSTITARVDVIDVSATYAKTASLSSTVPMTWTTSDEIDCTFTYEAA